MTRLSDLLRGLVRREGAGVELQGARIRTRETKRALMQLMERNFANDAERLFRAYYDGTINLRQLQQRFNLALKRLHVNQAAIGAGGWQNMTPQLWGRLGPILRRQYQFSRRFMWDLFDRAMTGRMPSPQYALWRAKLYAGVSEGSGRWMEILTEGESDDVMVWTRYLSDSCTTCIERDGTETRRSDVTFVPRDGSSECLSNCGCEWEKRD